MIGEIARRSFALDKAFIAAFDGQQPDWQPLGYITFLRTYSRGYTTKETVQETFTRVVEGEFSILKNHCLRSHLPWDVDKAQRAAQRTFQAMWDFKFLPPGRGLAMMGTDFITEEGGAPLNNCGFVTTAELNSNPTRPFTTLMDFMMLGVGVGFDTRGANQIKCIAPRVGSLETAYVIPDTRQGWIESIRRVLAPYLQGYPACPSFDYSLIREKGTPLKRFGGISSGPKPLIELHRALTTQLNMYIGSDVDSTLIVDIMNLIGRCVVSGNIRRGAEIALGDPDDLHFLNLKNPALKPNRNNRDSGWAWASNNSVLATVGMNYTYLATRSQVDGEPGYFWLENAQKYGRIKDGENHKDAKARGTNPCSEQTLEPYELCCLVETFPSRHETLTEYLNTLKLAYLYAKAVTLVPTHIPETNAVMTRNRRIGCSQSGITRAFAKHGRREMFRWSNTAYSFLKGLDKQYSEWLGVNASIKQTSVKPSGTVSLLAGEPPGIHYPHSEYYIRRVRFAKDDPLVAALTSARYRMEASETQPESTVVVEFPVKEPLFTRGKSEVSMWEQVLNAAAYQYWWADNQVSVTITFKENERKDIPLLLELCETSLKSVSFLPLVDHPYKQAPYEAISRVQYEAAICAIQPIKFDGRAFSIGSQYCEGDICDV